MPLPTINPAWTSQHLCALWIEIEHARDALREGDDRYADYSAAMDKLEETDADLANAGWRFDHCVARAS